MFKNKKLYYRLMKLYNKFNMASIDKEMVFIESNVGKYFSDSPSLIFEELYKQHPNLKYKLVINNLEFEPRENVEVISRLSLKYFYYLARAKFIINNQNFPNYCRFKKNQIYIQTWHGTPLKQMLNDIVQVVGRNDSYLDDINRATQKWDYLLSESPYTTRCFASAFKHSATVLETGFPRSDILYDCDAKELAIKEFKENVVDTDKKIILLAPTFREFARKTRNKYYHDLEIDFDKLADKLADDYIIVYKPHILLGTNIYCETEGFVYTLMDYDIDHLYLVSDIVITDYSSVMFDFGKISTKVILHVPDLELYSKHIRGLYLELEDLPYPKSTNTDDILNIILNEGFSDKKIEDVLDEFKYYSKGDAAFKVVQFINGLLNVEG